MVNDEDDATSSKVKTEDAPEPAAPVAPSKRQRSPERAAQTRQSTTAAGATPAAASPVVGTTPRSATPLSASQGKGSAASASETQPASSSTRKAASPAPGLPPVSKKRRVDLSLSADAGAGMSSPASAASERPLAPAPQQQPLVSPALSAASTGSRRASPATVPSTATEASTSALGKKPGPPATATATASTPKTRKEAIMDQLPLKRGRQAALRQPVRKGAPPGEEDWILVEVESTINNDKNRCVLMSLCGQHVRVTRHDRYIVVDREGDPGNAAETCASSKLSLVHSLTSTSQSVQHDPQEPDPAPGQAGQVDVPSQWLRFQHAGHRHVPGHYILLRGEGHLWPSSTGWQGERSRVTRCCHDEC